MSTLVLAGLDPSLSNFGFAFATYEPGGAGPEFEHLELVRPPTVKRPRTVRQNSNDLYRATLLAEASFALLEKHSVDVLFVEVPHGSQSARAMASYGICVGLLGAMQARGFPLIQLTALEVKLALTNDPQASKEKMVTEAVRRYPSLPWPMHRGAVSLSRAEHLADGAAAVLAGLASPDFLRLERLYRKSA